MKLAAWCLTSRCRESRVVSVTHRPETETTHAPPSAFSVGLACYPRWLPSWNPSVKMSDNLTLAGQPTRCIRDCGSLLPDIFSSSQRIVIDSIDTSQRYTIRGTKRQDNGEPIRSSTEASLIRTDALTNHNGSCNSTLSLPLHALLFRISSASQITLSVNLHLASELTITVPQFRNHRSRPDTVFAQPPLF